MRGGRRRKTTAERRWTYLARVERDAMTGAVRLDLIEDDRAVELHGGEEFVTVELLVDPFAKKERG